VYLDEIGIIDYAPQTIERYTEGFLKAVDVEAIRQVGFYIVVDYASAPTALVLPSILNELGCRVVALNANLDETKMAVLPEEFDRALEQLALICAALKADFGVRLDVGGEKIFVVDDQGRILADTTAAAALASLALRCNPGSTIAVPVHQPRLFETIAAQRGGQVRRTKVDPQDLMALANQEPLLLAADGSGGFIFPQFQPAIDGLMAVAKLLEYLAIQKTRLSEVASSLPAYFTAEAKVECPWEAKGRVMRRLSARYAEGQVEQIDGLKIYLDGQWVLILPDPDQSAFYVYGESTSDEQVKALVEEYARLVKDLQVEA
jgi:mannose-1-phosphate guanylyltransferase/phosphomannomutase